VFNGWDSDFCDRQVSFNGRDDIGDRPCSFNGRTNRQSEYSLGSSDVELDTESKESCGCLYNDEEQDVDVHVDIHEDEDDDIDSKAEYDFKLQSENKNAVHHRLGDDDTEEVPSMMATDVDTAKDAEEQASKEQGEEVQSPILDSSCTILDDASTLDDVSSSQNTNQSHLF
jgi:hypothetical protein